MITIGCELVVVGLHESVQRCLRRRAETVEDGIVEYFLERGHGRRYVIDVFDFHSHVRDRKHVIRRIGDFN